MKRVVQHSLITCNRCVAQAAVLGVILLAGCTDQAIQTIVTDIPANRTTTPDISQQTTNLSTAAVGPTPTSLTGLHSTTIATIAPHRVTLPPRDTRPGKTPRPGSPAVLDLPFQIKIGQTVQISSEGLAVTFLKVSEDSRCPVDVECVLAGQATIDLMAALHGSDLGGFSLTLGSDKHAGQNSISGYQITLSELEPIPDTRIQSPPDYVATLEVVLDTNNQSNYRLPDTDG